MATPSISPRKSNASRGNPRSSADTPEERLELSAHLMVQAVQAAILLLEEDKQPQLAADVLRLARDRWATALEAT